MATQSAEDKKFLNEQALWQKVLLVLVDSFGIVVAIKFIELHDLPRVFYCLIPTGILASLAIVKVINEPVNNP